MSYLALARKYRPQTFSEVLSQDFIISTLHNAIVLGRVAHAYLFTGPRGVGKTSTARIFAKALNCQNPINSAPCGECENCLEIVNGTSLDVIEIDGASNRGVEEIRSLRETVKFVPIKSKYKVIIIDEVHMLTEQAFNALLKTLEEPPEYVIFIFATTDQHKIPITILSRCQRYEFKKISYDEMNNNLKNILEKENIKYEESSLNYIIRNSDGCMRDALSLLDKVIAYGNGEIKVEDTKHLLGISDSNLSFEIFSAILKEEVEVLPELVDKIDEKGIDYKYITTCLITHTRNILIYIVSGKLSRDITDEEINYYSSLKEYAKKEKLYSLFQIFNKLINDLKYSDFPRYVFEFAIIKAGNISYILNILQDRANVPSGNVAPSSSSVSKPSNVAQGEKKEDINLSVNNNNKGIWGKILEITSAKHNMLNAMIVYAKVIKDTPEYLIISFPNDRQFQYRQVTSGNLKEIFEKVVKEVSGVNTKIEVKVEDIKNIDTASTNTMPTPATPISTTSVNEDIKKKNENIEKYDKIEDSKKKERIAELIDEVKDNEFIKTAMNELGCQIIDIERI